MTEKLKYYTRCSELIDVLFKDKDRLRPKDFAKKLAPINCAEKVAGWADLSEEDRKEHIKIEIDSMSSGIRKALYHLHRDGKIGRAGKSYIAIVDSDILEAEEYLFKYLHPSQKMVQMISQGAYVLSLEREAIPNSEGLSFSKKYDKDIEKIEADLKKVTEFILQSEKRRIEQVTARRRLSSYLKTYIGHEYCYDVLIEDERVVVLLNIEAVKKDTNMSEQKEKYTKKDIITSLNDLIERIYESNHPKMRLKKEGTKRIEGDRYAALENAILELASKPDKMSRKTLVEKLNITTYQASHTLRRMVASGKLKVDGRGAGAYYKVIKQ
ncbi:MAG: hypothetical protein E7400_03705 [Ruminococcaceae bacterium]|nr:hypothetical protein [Oscillospiraceae bacterium]